MEPIETEEYKGLTIEIYPDEDPMHPRVDWDNFGKMFCLHKRYNLGDKLSHTLECAKKNSTPMEVLREHLLNHAEENGWDIKDLDGHHGWDLVKFYLRTVEDAAVILPLYLYDHSGITISTGPFSCPWDSGQVGLIYATKADILKEFGDPNDEKVEERVEKRLEGEVESYDQYLTGDIYGFIIKDKDEEERESCWGFFGMEHCKEEARLAADAVAIAIDDEECTVNLCD